MDYSRQITSVKFSVKTDKKKQKVDALVKKLIKISANDPNVIFSYLIKHGTNVYSSRFSQKFLDLICEEQGFILPNKGFKGLLINLFVSIHEKKLQLSFESKPIFIINLNFKSKDFDIYTVYHHLYKWFCWKANMKGFDPQAQDLFKKIIKRSHKAPKISNLTLEQSIALKEAVARDNDAIAFVLAYSIKNQGSKNALKKIQTEKGATI